MVPRENSRRKKKVFESQKRTFTECEVLGINTDGLSLDRFFKALSEIGFSAIYLQNNSSVTIFKENSFYVGLKFM